MIDAIKWALDNFGALVDQRGRNVPWRNPPLCARCGGSKIIGGMRYHATGTLTDARSCPDCAGHG